MSDDIFSDPSDRVEVEPPELSPIFTKILTSTLAKRLAADYNKPWTADQETKMQGQIAELVAEAKKRELATIKMIVVKPSGQHASRDIDVNRLSRERKLQ